MFKMKQDATEVGCNSGVIAAGIRGTLQDGETVTSLKQLETWRILLDGCESSLIFLLQE